ncbi:putative traB domain-containing protein [Apostichopus japonicus]|uniref:Putative traB domain-containing protein n=1 Tax=Stichopus japonicus TaxID=307972 RepID=A0A2G8KHL2_STIJA|nr:putative traB domain-containing protein [Apostichopus japonicus]
MAQDTQGGLGYNEEKLDGSEGEDGGREGSYEMKSDRDSECDSLSDEGSYSPRKAEVEMNKSVTLEQGNFRKLEPNDRLGNGERLHLEDEDEIDVGLEEEGERFLAGDENPPRVENGGVVIADNELGDDSASEIGSYHVNSDKESVKTESSHESDAEYDLDSNESSGEEDTMDEVELIRMRELKRQDNPELPETVSKLVTPSGARVYLIGTAHFSEKSQEDVAKIIQSVQPDVVVLELCKSRLSILSLDEETLLREAQNLNTAKLRQSIQQVDGKVHVLVGDRVCNWRCHAAIITLHVSSSHQRTSMPQEGIQKAFKECMPNLLHFQRSFALELYPVQQCAMHAIQTCMYGSNYTWLQVHLGDRPIQITLKRAMSSLSIWQKLRLAWYLLTSKESITAEDVEKYKQKDLLEEMLGEITGEFPGLSSVFVTERDLFLAQSLKGCAQPVPRPDSLTGCYLPIVVGVVGMGHVPGIISNWTKEVTREEIANIVRQRIQNCLGLEELFA